MASHHIGLVDIDNLEEIFQILKDCKQAMEKDNVFQWTNLYPNKEIVLTDITHKHLYAFKEQGKFIGTITLNTIEDGQYQSVKWEDSKGKPLIIHRLAVSPAYQNKGIGKRLMDFAEEFAAINGFSSIRFDAYSGNLRSISFYEQRGYIHRGEVYFPGRTLPFFCYERMA